MINKLAKIIPTSTGVGVSSTAIRQWEEMFQSRPEMLGDTTSIAEIIAMDYYAGQPEHRFKSKLASDEILEIRKSKNFYFVGAIRSDGKHDVIVVQKNWRPVSEGLRKKRLEI